MNTGPQKRKLIILAACFALLLFFLFPPGKETQKTTQNVNPEIISYSQFVEYVKKDQVQSVETTGRYVILSLHDGERYRTYVPETENSQFLPLLTKHNVGVIARPIDNSSTLWAMLLSQLPMLFIAGILIWIMRSGSNSLNKFANFNKSRARLLEVRFDTVTFKDVAGVEEAKEDLQEIVDFLKNPHKFLAIGAQIPKGCLLIGPPGTGKTLLARAIAGEASVPFFAVSGSDFVEMFVGVGASRVRDMFKEGKENAPCIIFIDEIDALGRHRGAGLGGGHDEKEQTLNQLLSEMSGFESREGVIIIGATNRPDVLDPALLRPGRFDRHVVVPNPDILGREQILLIHMKKVLLEPDVDPKVIARGTPGFSGADLANLVNEAALLAVRTGKTKVSMLEFEEAKDKILMGVARRSAIMTEKDKERIAYHEAGHAIMTLSVPESDPLHKVTIIPRGKALGVTMSLPEKDQLTLSFTQLTSRLAILFGGRVAEEIVFNKAHVTTGASNDIQVATDWARRMVTEFGFSDKLGRIRYGLDEGEIFLGRSITQKKNISEETTKLIDEEVRRLIDEAEKTALDILTEKRSGLNQLARALLTYETLNGEEVKKILNGDPIRVNENKH